MRKVQYNALLHCLAFFRQFAGPPMYMCTVCILLGGEIEALSELSVIPFCFTNIAKSTKILYLVELTQKLNFLVHRFIIFAFFSKFDKDSKIKKKEKLVLQRLTLKIGSPRHSL